MAKSSPYPSSINEMLKTRKSIDVTYTSDRERSKKYNDHNYPSWIWIFNNVEGKDGVGFFANNKDAQLALLKYAEPGVRIRITMEDYKVTVLPLNPDKYVKNEISKIAPITNAQSSKVTALALAKDYLTANLITLDDLFEWAEKFRAYIDKDIPKKSSTASKKKRPKAGTRAKKPKEKKVVLGRFSGEPNTETATELLEMLRADKRFNSDVDQVKEWIEKQIKIYFDGKIKWEPEGKLKDEVIQFDSKFVEYLIKELEKPVK